MGYFCTPRLETYRPASVSEKKGVLSTLGTITADLFTLGGHTKNKEAMAEHDIAYKNYESIHKQAQTVSNNQAANVERIGEETQKAIGLLKKAGRLLKKYVILKMLSSTVL